MRAYGSKTWLFLSSWLTLSSLVIQLDTSESALHDIEPCYDKDLSSLPFPQSIKPRHNKNLYRPEPHHQSERWSKHNFHLVVCVLTHSHLQYRSWWSWHSHVIQKPLMKRMGRRGYYSCCLKMIHWGTVLVNLILVICMYSNCHIHEGTSFYALQYDFICLSVRRFFKDQMTKVYQPNHAGLFVQTATGL